jgi:hypothetical protein
MPGHADSDSAVERSGRDAMLLILTGAAGNADAIGFLALGHVDGRRQIRVEQMRAHVDDVDRARARRHQRIPASRHRLAEDHTNDDRRAADRQILACGLPTA